MAQLLFAFCVGLAFTVWLATRGEPTARRWRVLSFVGVIGAGAFLLRQSLAPAAVPAPASAEPTPTVVTATHLRARLLIPSLGVDAPTATVPLVDGEWDISRLYAEVGWLEATGDKPGADWAMAFIGHVTLSALERGPFADLWTLKPTMQIIYRVGGMDYLYAVLDIFKVRPQEVSRLFVPDGQRLLLVTCANWNYLTETYNARLVAEAVLVQEQPSP